MKKNINWAKCDSECDFNCLTEVSLFENLLISYTEKYRKWVQQAYHCLSYNSDFPKHNYTYICMKYMTSCYYKFKMIL